MGRPTPLSDTLKKLQVAMKSGFRVKEPYSLWAQGFFPVPVEAMRDPGLKPMHLLVLGLACRYSTSPAGLHLFASHNYLSGVFGVTERHIRRVLGDLVQLEYLEVERRAHGRHNVYLVTDRIPEARRAGLRALSEGLEFEQGTPRDRTYMSSQKPLSGTRRPVGTNKEMCTEREGASLCIVNSALKKKAAKLMKSGMSPRSARAEALRDWREGLDRRYTPEAMAKRLRYIGIRAKVARLIAQTAPGRLIVEVAGKLDAETQNPGGAFVWHISRLLADSRPERGP